MSLVGCSKELKYTWASSGMTGPNGPIVAEEFCRDSARTTTATGRIASAIYETNIMYCPHNYEGVEEDKMSKYQGAKYYTCYNDTQLVMFYPFNGYFIEGHVSLDWGEDAKVVAKDLYDALAGLPLNPNMTTIDIGTVMTLAVEGYNFKMREDDIIIPDVLRIKAYDNKVTMTDTVTIGDKTLGHASTTKYDYYLYENYLIQCTLGIDVSTLLTFK